MRKYLQTFLFSFIVLLSYSNVSAQETVPQPKWGPHDTIIVSAIYYNGEIMPYLELEMVYVSNLSAENLAKAIKKYNRLRNAVYVTYPYARTAGYTLNEVHSRLSFITSKSDRKKYIKSKEKELKDQFTEPLTNLSVYQGKVLMKLINRQTGNDCYEIIKEFKGGLNARVFQTVAFFFSSSLKQEYDIEDDNIDRQIESIVREIDGVWYNNAYKPGIRPK